MNAPLIKITKLEIAKRTWAEIRADDVFGRAAQLAYYFFLALFPFLICVIASLAVFGSADRGRALLANLFTRILPATAFQLIDKTVLEIIQVSGPLKMSLGIVASVWSASMGVSAIMDTLNATYKVKESRSLFAQYATAIGLTVGITVLVVLSLLVVILGNQFLESIAPGGIVSVVWKIAQWTFSLAVLLLVLAVTYYFAPNVKNRKWHWITPGSIAGVLLLITVCVGLRIYFHYSGSYNAVYGSLGAVIVLLICFYLGGVAVLSGGALNGVLENLSTEREVGQQRDSGSRS